MDKFTLIVPTIFVLVIMSDLGKEMEAYTVNGESIVTAIIISYGLWIMGYISGTKQK